MQKDFSGWNVEKQTIHTTGTLKLYHEWELWRCALGVNIGFEQDGTGAKYQRPILILKGLSRNTCYALPLTTSAKQHRYHVPIGVVKERKAAVIISQLRLVDTRRLMNKIGFLGQDTFSIVRKAVKGLL